MSPTDLDLEPLPASHAAPPPHFPAKPAVWVTILRNPVTRIVIFALVSIGLGWLLRQALPAGPKSEAGLLTLSGGALWLHLLKQVVGVTLAYLFLACVVEWRRPEEFRAARALRYVVGGWLVGTGILVGAALLMMAAGALHFNAATEPAALLAPFVVLGLSPGIGEEIVARGVLFRVVEDGMGTWFAVIFSGLLFGLGHIANPNATAWSSIAIAIEAGLLLGMAYAWTRSLWFVMSLHAAWNFTQGALLGIPVSGFAVHGLVKATPQGNAYLSGGAFGAEGSVLTVVLCVCIAAWFARKAIAADRIVRPFWKRDRLAWRASRAGVREAQAAADDRGMPPVATRPVVA